MRRFAFVLSGVFLVVGASGATVLGLWLSGAVWSGSPDKGFCDSLVEWHQAQDSFLRRTNQPGSRTGEGLSETEHMFFVSGEMPLPEGKSQRQLQVRDTLRELVKVEEEWLVELHALNVINPPTGPRPSMTASQRLEVFRTEEAKRMELNDLLREASADLEQLCSFPPLPLYSQ
jgi:hypothetical protein